MKKISYIIILIPCLLFALASFEIDNYEGPNASFFGAIKDAATGELVGTELRSGSIIRAFEQGFETPAARTWLIMNTGEFRNNMVFAARYDFEFSSCNLFPFTVEDFEIKPGDNEHDFMVTPYIRIKNANITH